MDKTMQSRVAEVLLVEDNENDVFLTQESFRQSRFSVRMHHVENGEECMKFLRREAPYADAPIPDLVLLDLNLPVMNGREVLAEMVKDEEMSHIPVVIVTTSEDERDVLAMYKLRCSAYVSKPIDFNRFQEVIQNLGAYWFTLVTLPPNEPEQSPADAPDPALEAEE